MGVRIQKNRIKLKVIFLFCMLMIPTGCNYDEKNINFEESTFIFTESAYSDLTTPYSNSSTSETVKISISEVSNNQQSEDLSNKESDTECINIIDETCLLVISKEFRNALLEWKERHNIVRNNFLYCVIEQYSLITSCSGEVVGNTQTPYIIVDCCEKTVEIDADEILYSTWPIYFIKDDTLYIFDQGLVAGIEHIYFSEFSLTDGVKTNEYLALCSLGENTPEEIINTYLFINNTDQLVDYMFKVSSEWYRCQIGAWDQLLCD